MYTRMQWNTNTAPRMCTNTAPVSPPIPLYTFVGVAAGTAAGAAVRGAGMCTNVYSGPTNVYSGIGVRGAVPLYTFVGPLYTFVHIPAPRMCTAVQPHECVRRSWRRHYGVALVSRID